MSARPQLPQQFYVVCYDIPDDRRRERLAKCLDGLGRRVQYSVFELNLDRPLFDNLVIRLRKMIDPTEDRLQIYPLCKNCLERSLGLGRAAVDLRPGQPIVLVI